MRKEFWVFMIGVFFFGVVTPAYWVLSGEIAGSVALLMTGLLFAMVSFYLFMVSKTMPPRPEDRPDGEIADGAGELGFFPPYSWWPLYLASTMALVVLGVAIGWWMFILAVPLLGAAVVGWVFEYYRGLHAH